MSNQLQPFRLGRHLTAGPTIARIQFDSSGNPTVGAATDLHAWIKGVTPRLSTTRRNIKPSWSTQDNMVPVSGGSGLTLRVFARSDAVNGLTSLIFTANVINDRFRIIYTLGTEVKTFDGTFADWSDPYEDEGESIMDCNFDPCELSLGGNLRLS